MSNIAKRFYERHKSYIICRPLTGLYEHNKAPNDTDGNQAIMIKNKPAIAHFASNNVGGKLLLISRDAWRVISLNNTGYFTSSIVCPDSANSRQHFDDAIDVVKEGSDYYAYGKDGDKIFKSQIVIKKTSFRSLRHFEKIRILFTRTLFLEQITTNELCVVGW